MDRLSQPMESRLPGGRESRMDNAAERLCTAANEALASYLTGKVGGLSMKNACIVLNTLESNGLRRLRRHDEFFGVNTPRPRERCLDAAKRSRT